MTSADPSALLPLRPNWFHILLTLFRRPHHGYSIMREVQDRTGGKVRLWPATLYGTIRRLQDEGLIESVAPNLPQADERRQYYALTPFGKQVLQAEVQRLEELVHLARSEGAARA